MGPYLSVFSSSFLALLSIHGQLISNCADFFPLVVDKSRVDPICSNFVVLIIIIIIIIIIISIFYYLNFTLLILI